jgi:hypothetical protein
MELTNFDNQTFNFIVFFILLIVIIYLSCVDKNYLHNLFVNDENFSNQINNQIDNKLQNNNLHKKYFELKSPLVPITKNNIGWKQLYQNKYLNGTVDYVDCFNGIVTRNYFDNMKFFVN